MTGLFCASSAFSLLRTLKEKEQANRNLCHRSNAAIFLQFNLVVSVWVVNVGRTAVIFRVFVIVDLLCDGLLIVVGRSLTFRPLLHGCDGLSGRRLTTGGTSLNLIVGPNLLLAFRSLIVSIQMKSATRARKERRTEEKTKRK